MGNEKKRILDKFASIWMGGCTLGALIYSVLTWKGVLGSVLNTIAAIINIIASIINIIAAIVNTIAAIINVL